MNVLQLTFEGEKPTMRRAFRLISAKADMRLRGRDAAFEAT
jgi:hypothetical protein